MTSAARERVVTFGENGGLTGILTLPAAEQAPGTPYVVLLNSGLIHRVGPNRLHVELARALATSGIPALRFDLSGIGDSERQSTALSLPDSVTRDIDAALTLLASEYGAERFVMVGLCSGAFDAFQTALREPRVTGAVMLDMPGPFQHWRQIAYHLMRRAFRWRSWRTNPFKKLVLYTRALIQVSLPETPTQKLPFAPGIRSRSTRAAMRAQLDRLLARDVKLYFIFTAGLEQNYNHESQFKACFPTAAAHRGLSLDFIVDSDHLFSSRRTRANATKRIHAWMLKNVLALSLLFLATNETGWLPG